MYRVAYIGCRLAAIPPRSPGNHGSTVGINGACVMGHNRGESRVAFSPFRAARYRGRNGPDNYEASEAAIRAHLEGRPYGRWGGGDSPEISRESRVGLWGLTAPDALFLFAAKNSSFLAIPRWQVKMSKWARKRGVHSRVKEPAKRAPRLAECRSRFPHDLSEATGQSLGINGA